MELREFFKTHNKAALALSGGADSAYLLWAGLRFGADIKPYCVSSVFQPEFELRDAKKLCDELGIELTVIEIDVLSEPEIENNAPLRCYYCKKMMFSELIKRAAEDGYDEVIDGTNASDDYDDRPGMRAIRELGVLSPLQMCGITKDRLRELSHEAGLHTWNKPSYSCLATRVKAGEKLSVDKLRRVADGEKILFDMGFSDFRLRASEKSACLQVKAEQADTAKGKLEEIKDKLKPYFSEVTLDSKFR